jgi:hypothetical protein
MLVGSRRGRKNTTSFKVETAVRNQLVDDGEGTRLKAGFLRRKFGPGWD